MTTAVAIHGRNGEELLPQGTVLDRGLIESIVRRGLGRVHILVVDDRTAERILDDVAMAEKRVLHIFRGGGSVARDELYRAVAAFRLRQAS